MKQRNWGLILIAGLVAVVLAWQPRGGTAPASGVAAGDEPDLVMVTFFGELLPGLREAAAQYADETGVEVLVQGMPYTSFEMWLRTQLLTKEPPELILIESTMLPWYYGQAGLLVELSGAVAEPNAFGDANVPWGRTFREPYLQLCRDATGALWCLPFTQYGVGFFYNRDHYEALGLTPPETWSELVGNFAALDDAEQTSLFVAITRNDAQTAWIVSIIEEWLMRRHIPAVNLRHEPGWEFDPYDPLSVIDERIDLDERIVAFERGIIDPLRSPDYVEVLRLMRQAAQHWEVELANLDVTELERVFLNAGTTHFMNGTWYFPVLANRMELLAEVAPEAAFAWGTFPFPELGPEDTTLPTAGGTNQNAGMRGSLIIPKQPLRPRQEAVALRFCQYLTSVEGMSAVMTGDEAFDIPAVKGVEPKPAARPLLTGQSFAWLPVSTFTGYDAQSYGDFWPIWQRWFSGASDEEAFLADLHDLHVASLVRLYERFHESVDHDFIRAELDGRWPDWLEARE
jgi:ABC-type glycerol-3-phosphate transport system substrate-binding protein